MKPAMKGAIAICAAATLWGLDGVVLTPRLFGLSVPVVVFLVHAIPFLLMQPFLFSEYRTLARMDAKSWLALLLVALMGGVLGTLAIVKALFLVHFTELSVVVLLQKLQPVFAIVLAAALLKERITGRFLFWATIALAGAYLLTFGFASPDAVTGGVREAALWAVIAAAAFGSATVLGKRLLNNLDFKAATFGRFGMTAILTAGYMLVAGIPFAFGSVTATEWLIIGIIALTTGSTAIFIYYWGLTRVKASVSTICELCLPVSAVLFDWLINGTVLGFGQWVGAAVLVAAIIRVSMLGRKGVTSTLQSP